MSAARSAKCPVCCDHTDQLDPGGRPTHEWCRRRYVRERQIRRAVEVEETAEDGLVNVGRLEDCVVCSGSTWLAVPDGPPIHRRCMRRLYVEDQHLGLGSLAMVLDRYLRHHYAVSSDLDHCLVCSGLTFMREESMGGPAHLLCWQS